MSKQTKKRHERKKEYFSYLDETAKAVDPYVRQFIQSRYDSNVLLMQKLIERYRFGRPQLRPAQVRLAYELSGGKTWEEVIPACASLEMKDTGYYCYDDVIDLRKRPDLIVVGGTFLSGSWRMIGDLNQKFSGEIVNKIIEELAELDSENAGAALIDLSLREPNIDLYLQKAKGYNFWERALRIGAILGGADENKLNRIGSIGRNIGIGYIIANDTWDFGKNLEDFRARKYTLPNILALDTATQNDRKTLESLFGQEYLTNEQINEIRRIVVQNQVIERGKKLAWEYCEKGLEILAEFPNSRSRTMIEFSTTMTQRNKYFDLLNRYEQGEN